MAINSEINLRKFIWEDIEGIELKLYKKEEGKIFSPSKESTMTILLGDKPIGLIDLGGIEKGLHIFMLEVFEKGRGYGKIIVQELQNCPEIEKLELNPSDNASYNFWVKMGFVLLNDGETMLWTKNIKTNSSNDKIRGSL